MVTSTFFDITMNSTCVDVLIGVYKQATEVYSRYMNKDIQRTALRLPRDLHTAILEAAAESGRSMNAEIVYHLQKAMDAKARAPIDFVERNFDGDPEKYIEWMSKQLEGFRKAKAKQKR